MPKFYSNINFSSVATFKSSIVKTNFLEDFFEILSKSSITVHLEPIAQLSKDKSPAKAKLIRVVISSILI